MPQTMLTMAGGGPRAQVLDFGRRGQPDVAYRAPSWGTWQVVASDIAESMLQHGRDSASASGLAADRHGPATLSSVAIRSSLRGQKPKRRGVFSSVWRVGWRRHNP